MSITHITAEEADALIKARRPTDEQLDFMFDQRFMDGDGERAAFREGYLSAALTANGWLEEVIAYLEPRVGDKPLSQGYRLLRKLQVLHSAIR